MTSRVRRTYNALASSLGLAFATGAYQVPERLRGHLPNLIDLPAHTSNLAGSFIAGHLIGEQIVKISPERKIPVRLGVLALSIASLNAISENKELSRLTHTATIAMTQEVSAASAIPDAISDDYVDLFYGAAGGILGTTLAVKTAERRKALLSSTT